MRSVLYAFCVAALTAPNATADPAAGRVLAERWCVKCHDIEAGAPFKLHPPSFASIAVYRAPEQIQGKIISPHIGMPDVMWTLQILDVQNLVDYIASLEAK